MNNVYPEKQASILIGDAATQLSLQGLILIMFRLVIIWVKNLSMPGVLMIACTLKSYVLRYQC